MSSNRSCVNGRYFHLLKTVERTLFSSAKDCREFHVITDSFNDINAVTPIIRLTNTIVFLFIPRNRVSCSGSCVNGRYYYQDTGGG